MQTATIGFIGCGNMAQAIIAALVQQHYCPASQIWVYNRSADKVSQLQQRYPITAATDLSSLVNACPLVVLAVKPAAIETVLTAIKADVTRQQILVSIAAGTTLATLAKQLPANSKIARVMPNTPALVNAAMSSLSVNEQITAAETDQLLAFCRCFGQAELLPESLIHAVIGVSGSAPAYVYLFIEAMADGAVRAGMPRDKAYYFAAQAVLGAAQMVLTSGQHPGQLKDAVCSPAGTTIEAVACLEDQGFRKAVLNAMQACIDKSIQLSQQH